MFMFMQVPDIVERVSCFQWRKKMHSICKQGAKENISLIVKEPVFHWLGGLSVVRWSRAAFVENGRLWRKLNPRRMEIYSSGV